MGVYVKITKTSEEKFSELARIVSSSRSLQSLCAVGGMMGVNNFLSHHRHHHDCNDRRCSNHYLFL